jgi:toxin HigB-1
MIRDFRCRDTQALFEGGSPRKFKAIVIVAERKLQMLDDACSLGDLRVPPGNRLEALHGDRKGQWSIRINDRWRICFRFGEGDAFDVEIVDYH